MINVNGYTTKRLFTIIDNILYFWRKFLSKINLLDKSKSKKYKWKKVYISFNDAHNRFRTKIYEVYITTDNPRFEYVIKPKSNSVLAESKVNSTSNVAPSTNSIALPSSSKAPKLSVTSYTGSI